MKYNQELLLFEKIKQAPTIIISVTLLLFAVGVMVLYSASKGNFYPWSYKHIVNALIAMPAFLIIMLTNIRVWFNLSYLLYIFGIFLLLAVKFFGVEGGLGAQRWLRIGGFTFQPSELVKVFLVLALAKYYHSLHFNNLHKIRSLFFPLILIGIAAGLVLKQPNLGTASIMCLVSAIIIFLTGLSWKKITFILIAVLASLPLLWANMHDYQKKRVETFLNPEKDPLGAGYNIIQSKIAIGSGGLLGKGLAKGTQSQLNFVPEQQTDFIFSIVAEEFGFLGSLIVIILYGFLFSASIRVSYLCKSMFAKIAAVGMSSIIFVHVFVNIGMVSGVLPVVGVPLPLVSYGGSSLISTLIAIAFIANAYIHRDYEVGRESESQ
jgi:rod shape determining protein RodA